MFDTMTITKAFGSLCGALLILLLGGWAAEGLYNVDTTARITCARLCHHRREGRRRAEPGGGRGGLRRCLRHADAGAGERLWRQCQACHALNPGPERRGSLPARRREPSEAFGGRVQLFRRAAVAGWRWTPENMAAFLENPRAYAPGTAMAFNGISDVEDRANLIAYLATQQ
jgi:cytochrome c